jgi:hypothetical protein
MYIVTEARKVNLCGVYMLPLLGLNPTVNFGSEMNFMEAYISHDGTLLYVKVMDAYADESPFKHKEFTCIFATITGASVICFRCTELMREVFPLFVQGRYSEFPEEAKQLIIKYSSLKWKELGEDGVYYSDARLLALYKDPALRSKIEEELGLRIPLSEDSELLGKPKEEEFVTYKPS